MATNGTFTSPLAGFMPSTGPLGLQLENVVDSVLNVSLATWLVTILALAVAYDQSTCFSISLSALRSCTD